MRTRSGKERNKKRRTRDASGSLHSFGGFAFS
jgi:hypothetical protein